MKVIYLVGFAMITVLWVAALWIIVVATTKFLRDRKKDDYEHQSQT